MSPAESWMLIGLCWAVLFGLIIGITDWLDYRRQIRDARRRHPAYTNTCPECGSQVYDWDIHDQYCEARQ